LHILLTYNIQFLDILLQVINDVLFRFVLIEPYLVDIDIYNDAFVILDIIIVYIEVYCKAYVD
jgi:hypothetical protein